MNDKDRKFTWVQTHKELVDYLSRKENKQQELIELLKKAGATIFNDRDVDGNVFDLEEIDPFTFFCYIYKYGEEKRLEILQNVAKKADVFIPKDEKGIPSANAQKVWMFPYKKDRNNDEINRLWRFFFATVMGSIDNEQFQDVLKIQNVAETKITEALFYVKPDTYLPINKPTIPYLKEKLGIDPKFQTWQEYVSILKKVRAKTDKPFYEVSYEAWLWNEEHNKKNELIENWRELLENYKSYRKANGLGDEIYKWEAVQHFQDTFDLEADDFGANLKDAISKSDNLLYRNSKGFINKAATYFPEEVREMFRGLYNEEKPLEQRLLTFEEQAEELLPKVSKVHGKELNHQQDERTLSFYLTMRFPDQYPIYKDDIYQYLLSEVTNQKSKSAGEKFLHYLELANELTSIIEKDEELLSIIRDRLNADCYKGEQKWLVFQDILWLNMRGRVKNLEEWHYDRKWVDLLDSVMKIEDESSVRKFFVSLGKILEDLDISGDEEKIYASAIDKRIQLTIGSRYVARIQRKRGGVNIGYYIYENDLTSLSDKYADMNVSEKVKDVDGYDMVWVDLPAEEVDPSDFFEAALKVAKTGYNGQVKSQFRSIHEDKHNSWIAKAALKEPLLDELLSNFYLVGATWDKAESKDQTSRFIEEGIWENGYDDKFLDEVHEVEKGDKIAIKAAHTRNKTESVMTIKAVGVVLKNFNNGRKLGVEWDLEFEPFVVPFSGGYWKTIHKVENAEQIGAIWYGIDLEDSTKEKFKKAHDMELEYPLNSIFYGPPGTGKTYTTIKRAAEIVKGQKIDDYGKAKAIFNEQLGDTIEFITFHQNYSYEDFIQGLRPDIENSQQLTFERTDGIFKKLADKALKNWKASRSPQTKKQSFERVFNEFIQPLVEGEVEELEVQMKRVSYYITAVTDKSIDFRKSNGATSHTLSINKLRKMYEAESVLEIQGLSSYYSPLLEELLDIGKSPGETEQVDLKNYVIIIDEINRANISRVFGELITLIEPDKRYGRDLHIPAKLPSGESFSVPENLYIIGTMNTADKSIALLDIALRRRFNFEAMYPEYAIKDQQIYNVEVLKMINERIVKLKGHDFQIGHSYFMDKELSLKKRMNRKVIPLLLEYFMNDDKEVKDILNHAGLEVEEKSWPLRITGKK